MRLHENPKLFIDSIRATANPRSCFKFSDNFLRMTFPGSIQATEQATEQATKLLSVLGFSALSTKELMSKLGLNHRPTFLYEYLKPALEDGCIERTIPEKPNSPKQKYRMTAKGSETIKSL